MRDATHIAVLLDRSGSMGVVKDETISGFNYFLKEQKAAGDNATFTLVQFDSESTDAREERWRRFPKRRDPTRWYLW